MSSSSLKSHTVYWRQCLVAGGLLLLSCLSNAAEIDDWFREFKRTANPIQMYQLLWAMPKGGDLHHHLTGSGFSEWWYDIATQPNKNGGYVYYTKTQISLCNGYGTNEFGPNPQHLLFRTIQASTYQRLSPCEKQEYQPLADLTTVQKSAFLNSIRLDKPHEGRNEFFETHWQRLNELSSNPHIGAYILLKNMQSYAQEGLLYLETQVNVKSKMAPDGSLLSPEQSLAVYTQMLNSPAAKKTGVTVRFQYALLRYLPNAEQQLRWLYNFVDQHRDIYVGINFVGREDNDKGHPLRFLQVLRDLRRQYPEIKLSIHAGEVDEPSQHVKDTLLLGATRIGHGLNTITDPDTLLLMRNGPYLIEINLISNQLLEYTEEFRHHPFPEYLRTGIPVALSTDDRGMWDSTLTDEYYIAVKEFNLSWQELIALTKNSLSHSFLSAEEQHSLLDLFADKLAAFSEKILTHGVAPLATPTSQRAYICTYEEALCAEDK